MGALLKTLREISGATALSDLSEREGEEILRTTMSEARAAWPGVDVDDHGFMAHLAERLAKDEAITGQTIASTHTADLYLAYACMVGHPGAIARFREKIVADLDRAIVPVDSDDKLNEVRQLVMDRLLVRSEGLPKIAAYHGRGALHAWVRVMAARVALSLARVRSRNDVSLADLALEAGPEANPELAHVKATYRYEVKVSIERALAELSTRERNLLRYTLLDGLTADELGALYEVHRATAARWVVSARETLARAAKNDLAARLGLAKLELDSLFTLIDSQFEMSWSLLRA